ncbi:OmcA/MtrC family decaheme c-type cytochrome [Shewanella vaxholmensis]|uniref:OmcA/MtrC family decaheme c-type cytochrome n=1 Tax=Shewanella vaxholmensis TaxID=3063535 RepID=A0ABU9URP3_9GAMM|nr:OmcA/MtrC family decaheme c-type cytochrome [Shewanella sp. SP1S1-4]MDT3306871.1 OmcA/MtrC family decaheme c-type cytochrome [Shewanella sp. SP1S1-4]
MMNAQTTKIALLLAASAVTMALTGCGGSDGNDGNPGEPGGEPAGSIHKLNLDITKVNYENDSPVVTVFATNEDDLPIVGLANLEIKKALQLIPQGATGPGNSANWQGLGSSKNYVDNKNGSYTFKFDTFDSNKVFNTQLTQRFNVVSAAGKLPDGTSVPVAEMVEDFDGQGNAPLYTKNIVSHEVCTTCHVEGEKIYHQATEVETCISCHTQEFADGRGKPHVTFSHLIHNVHNANKAWGKNNKVPEVAQHIVQDNCQVCHVESDMLTEAKNWSRIPTMEVCSSCHVDIDFAAGKGHSQQLDNSNCIACHNSDWTAELHTGKTAEKKAVMAQLGMSATLAGQEDNTAVLTVSVFDKDGNAIDAATVQDKIKRLETVTNVGPNFPIMGYNKSPGSGAAKIAKDLVKDGALQAGVTLVDGKLVFTTPALPFGAGDTDTAFTFIGLEMCSTGTSLTACTVDSATTSMKAELAFGTKSGNAPSMRHVNSVNFNTCQGCHSDTFEIHKGHHSGFVMTEQVSHAKDANGKAIVGVDACVACHTPDGTYASGANKGAFEMKLHVIHGEQGVIKECTQCHNDFNLDAFKVKGALATSAGKYTTPITATCTSCHAPESIGHGLENMGAIVNGDYVQANQAAQSETCFYCHKPTPTDHTQVKM